MRIGAYANGFLLTTTQWLAGAQHSLLEEEPGPGELVVDARALAGSGSQHFLRAHTIPTATATAAPGVVNRRTQASMMQRDSSHPLLTCATHSAGWLRAQTSWAAAVASDLSTCSCSVWRCNGQVLTGVGLNPEPWKPGVPLVTAAAVLARRLPSASRALCLRCLCRSPQHLALSQRLQEGPLRHVLDSHALLQGRLCRTRKHSSSRKALR
jgi:hypothetical protein